MVHSLLIGLGGKLLEGFFANRAAKQQRAQSVEDVKQQFVRLREGAELAGFNPLAVLGTASGIPAQAGSGAYMGTALADSALMIADSLARSEKAGTLNKVNALEAENRDLLGRLTAMTLRPKVPGIYGGGGVQAVSGASDSVAASGGPRLAFGFPGPLNWGDPAIRSESDDASRVPAKSLFLFGTPFEPTSGTSDAEAVGSRYGEDFLSPGWFSGWGSFGVDAMVNAARGLRRYSDGKGLTKPGVNYPAEVWARYWKMWRGVDEWDRRGALHGFRWPKPPGALR